MAILSGEIAVPAGSASIVVTGAFAASYQLLGLTPDWVTTCADSGKTATQFTVTFGTVPLVDGVLSWAVNLPNVPATATPGAIGGAGYDGVTVVEMVLGREGLYGLKNSNLIPLGGLRMLRNATLEDHSVRTGGGASVVGDAFGGGVVAGMDAFDWWPDPDTQRTVVVGDDGKVYKDDGTGHTWVEIFTGLTTAGFVPQLVPGGLEGPADDRKLFLFSRVNPVKVLTADGVAMTTIALPPADWIGLRQPTCGVVHQGYLWAALKHTLYRSKQDDHENFTGTPYTLPVFSGDGDEIVALRSYKGVLLVWKSGNGGGVWAIDTSDADDTNWRAIKVGSAGCAGPRNPVAIEDDIIWVAEDGTWHLISATTATGSVRSEDIAARKLGSFHRDNLNLPRLRYGQMIYYAHKQEAILGASAIGQNAKNRRLHLDLNRRTEIGDRWIWWDRDRNEALFTRKVAGIDIPAMIDEQGRLWNLDQTERNAEDSAYTFEWFTRDSDFGEIVPGWQGRYKNLRFLQVEYDAKSAASHDIEIYIDGILRQTITFNLASSGAVLPFVLPALLGETGLQLSARRRAVCRGRRIAFRGRSTVVNNDISIMRLLIGLEAA